MNIYLASSWKNERQVKELASLLRAYDHDVDAFCDPSTGRYVFSFDQLPDVANINAMTALEHEPVQKAFAEDKGWIDWAEVVLMLLPCGKSAHLEAGYAKGSGKQLVIYQETFPTGEFDVMYGFADLVTDDWYKVVDFLDGEHVSECTETCDVCGRTLDQMLGEDFYDEGSGHVYCSAHWPHRNEFVDVRPNALKRLEVTEK